MPEGACAAPRVPPSLPVFAGRSGKGKRRPSPRCLLSLKTTESENVKKRVAASRRRQNLRPSVFLPGISGMNEEVTLLGCFSASDQSQSALFCHSVSIPTSLRVQNVAPPYGPRGLLESGHAQSVQDAGQDASAQSWCPFKQKSSLPLSAGTDWLNSVLLPLFFLIWG